MVDGLVTQDILAEIVQSATATLNASDTSDYAIKDSPDKWSKKEILGHLIDSAINNHRRFKQFLHQEHLVFDGYSQDDEVKINDYQNRPLVDIINLWTGMNNQVVQIIKAIPSARLAQSYSQHNFHRIGFKRIPEAEASTIQYLILDYIGHLEHHLSQILEGYERKLRDYENKC